MYNAFQRSSSFTMVEDNKGHASTKKNREAMYAFFQEHLSQPGRNNDVAVELFAPEELHVTSTGQLATSVQSRFLTDINKDLASINQEKRAENRSHFLAHPDDFTTLIKSLSGFELSDEYGKLTFSGRTEHEAYYVDKYLVEKRNKWAFPFTILLPRKSN